MRFKKRTQTNEREREREREREKKVLSKFNQIFTKRIFFAEKIKLIVIQ
jgi:hypothetical protein